MILQDISIYSDSANIPELIFRVRRRLPDFLYSADNMTDIDLATNSFGQNFNVTMTQLVSAFCSLVNGGYYYEPHVVKQIQDEDGNVIETKRSRTAAKDCLDRNVTDNQTVLESDHGLWYRTECSG